MPSVALPLPPAITSYRLPGPDSPQPQPHPSPPLINHKDWRITFSTPSPCLNYLQKLSSFSALPCSLTHTLPPFIQTGYPVLYALHPPYSIPPHPNPELVSILLPSYVSAIPSSLPSPLLSANTQPEPNTPSPIPNIDTSCSTMSNAYTKCICLHDYTRTPHTPSTLSPASTSPHHLTPWA